jgi:hypothetical protein
VNIITYSFDTVTFQAKLNHVKDQLIAKINADHGLSLDPAEYVYVIRTKGCLGRILDKLMGKLDDDESQYVLLRIHVPKAEE